MESAMTSLIDFRISSGMSRRSFSFFLGRITILAPERCAARILLLSPPIGSTRPRRVISPVIATSLRTGMPVKAETIAVAMVTPADGPSAGVTMATAMVSALTGIPIRKDVAMTGEITLRGRVLPIGGLKSKILAAHLSGAGMVILPKKNEKDLRDIPEEIRKQVKLVLAETMDQVLEAAPRRRPQPLKPIAATSGNESGGGSKGTAVSRVRRSPFPGDQPTVVAGGFTVPEGAIAVPVGRVNR